MLENLILGLLGSNLGDNLFIHFFFFFFEVSALLDVIHSPKLQYCATPGKTNDANLRK